VELETVTTLENFRGPERVRLDFLWSYEKFLYSGKEGQQHRRLFG